MDFCKEKQYQSIYLSEEFPAVLSSLYCTLLSFLLGMYHLKNRNQAIKHYYSCTETPPQPSVCQLTITFFVLRPCPLLIHSSVEDETPSL